jgi:phage repressor protein C with HTH and peptisase S24 domain
MTDSMYPRYDAGDLVFVDSNRPPSVGDDVIVELHAAEDGTPGAAFIKRLRRRSGSKVEVEQFNPPKELSFDTADVKLLHRVVPSQELLPR